MTALSEASIRQNQASEPGASTWLSANAGSGKTRVLTDRVARLLLAGADPQNILCLTYTKAAASEMQNRLFKTLGGWSMKPEPELRAALANLGEDTVPDIDRARTLFARAIETPGGLRIQTIHSFCSSILRRFPLEAGVTPTFTEMDETQSAELKKEVINQLLETDPAAVAGLLELAGHDRLIEAADSIVSSAHAFKHFEPDNIARDCGIAPDLTEDDVVNALFTGGDRAMLQRVAAVLATGSSTAQKQADRLLSALGASDVYAVLPEFEALFLFGETAKAPFASKREAFPSKALRSDLGPVADELDAFMDRVEAARESRLGLVAFRRTCALHDFARVFLPAYSEEKTRRGVLDYDDLIQKTLGLLTDSSDAAWVLYKLDGDIDHILIDEAQDTSPDQWRVIGALAEDIAAGSTDRERTIFVVGDKKQSIYSFQGADPREFDRMRAHFGDRLRDGPGLSSLELAFSFRSSQAILSSVDETLGAIDEFAPDLGARHHAFDQSKPGRVDLWPRIEGGEPEEDQPWWEPIDTVSEAHHAKRLAKAVATEIKRLIENETLPAKKGQRRITAGDVMILLQARSGYNELFYAIISACKTAGLDVAGADRLKLGRELAARDLIALLSFVALPEDDLALATALRSPLLGWSEGDLYDLAVGRGKKYLWEVLRERRGGHTETFAVLDDLRRNSDFLRPFELIDRVLVRHDGRRRLLARLGDEAEDGIDELLNQALAFERGQIPSLTRFLAWIATEDVTIKRQLDASGDKVRVMTVHGAKGLEAPIVILPDATRPERRRSPDLVRAEGGIAHWPMPRAQAPRPISEALDAYDLQQQRERLRLMYVAMTRAENWLIVCGSGDAKNTWYDRISTGLELAGAAPHDFGTGPGLRLEHGNWSGPLVTMRDNAPEQLPLPDWAHLTVPTPERRKTFVSPSDLGGAKVLTSDGEVDRDDGETAMARGTLLHRLLEVLPNTPQDRRRALAERLCAEVNWPDSSVIEEALDLLASPAFSALIGQDILREVEVAAPTKRGDRIILGAIDLLHVSDRRVLAVDFKSNAVVPDSPDQVPDGILRQMGAYAHALAQIYPDHEIETAILWTRTACLMSLPHEIVSEAFDSAAIS